MLGLDEIEQEVLKTVANIDGIPEGAYNFRLNGQSIGRKSSENIDVKPKTNKSGLEIYISKNAQNEAVHIPVIISKSGLEEAVYNDFFIEDGAIVTIVAGCGIYNCGTKNSTHNGIHTFHVGKNCQVKYIEKHYGAGAGSGKILNPTTKIFAKSGSVIELELEQIKGVDSTKRRTEAILEDDASIRITEKVFTEGRQNVDSSILVDLTGENSTADIVSRSVARDSSRQELELKIIGQKKCRGHSECDAILMDQAGVLATPSLDARCLDAELIHEAAIGKIAGEQIEKLMTLGLTEEQAVAQIINGFLA